MSNQMPVLLARIGWMTFYRGQQNDDPHVIGGGKLSYFASEAYNFRPLNEKLFGHIQPQMKSKRIALERIVPKQTGSSVDGVLLIFFATHPKEGGQRVVGWYQNATVYRDGQPLPLADKPKFKYRAVVDSRNAVLLPTNRRNRRVVSGRGGAGQSNVCYVLDSHGLPKRMPWLGEIIDFVKSYSGPNLITDPDAEIAEDVRGGYESALAAGFERDPKVRKAIEDYPMDRAEGYFRDLAYSVNNVSTTESYDLLCERGSERLYVEVKGTRGPANGLIVTNGEVEFAKKKGTTALFIVHSVKVNKRRKVSGGEIRVVDTWHATTTLMPLAFKCLVPKASETAEATMKTMSQRAGAVR